MSIDDRETNSFLETGGENKLEIMSSNRWCNRTQCGMVMLLSAAIFALGFMSGDVRRRNTETSHAAPGVIETSHTAPTVVEKRMDAPSVVETTQTVSHRSFISEYDLIRTFSTYYDCIPKNDGSRYGSLSPDITDKCGNLIPDINAVNTPLQFETAVRAMGVTDDEYAACASSIHKNPDQRICAKLGEAECYRKADAENETPIKIQCPQSSTTTRSDAICYEEGQYSRDAEPSLCYITAPCLEQVSQWNATNVGGGVKFWHTTFSTRSKTPAWNGGLVTEPVTLNYTNFFGSSSNSDEVRKAFKQTDPYQGKFCLQKAALKALSCNGWELTDPSTAFASEYWTVIKKTPV